MFKEKLTAAVLSLASAAFGAGCASERSGAPISKEEQRANQRQRAEERAEERARERNVRETRKVPVLGDVLGTVEAVQDFKDYFGH